MEQYPKNGNGSAITGYEIYTDRIYVRYHGGRVYGYSYESAGKDHIEEMKRLAEAGEGLARYINENVNQDYFFKGRESDILPKPDARSTESLGSAEMPEALRCFDFREYRCDCDRYDRGVEVFYSQKVAEADKVPGLEEFVAAEYAQIIHYMMNFFNSDRLPFEIYIELSDRHKVSRYGTMTDSQIVNEIQGLFRQNNNPDPQKIQAILAKRISRHDISGSYSMRPCHIELYYRMFDTSRGPDAYLAQVRNTLAHELLHAKHHIDAPYTFHEKTTEAVRVKESLADFFAFLYSLDPNTCCWGRCVAEESVRVAEKRYHAWERKIGGSWPYAYALMLLACGYGTWMPFSDCPKDYMYAMDKYRAVWDTSISSMLEADYILMH